MPIQVTPFLDERIIYMRAYGVVTIDDVRAVKSITLQLTQHLPNKNIHFIGDIREIEEIPLNLRLICRTNFMVAGLTGWTAVVGSSYNPLNKVAELTITALSRVMNFRLRIFDEVVDALDFLMDADDTLPDVLERYERGRFTRPRQSR